MTSKSSELWESGVLQALRVSESSECSKKYLSDLKYLTQRPEGGEVTEFLRWSSALRCVC